MSAPTMILDVIEAIFEELKERFPNLSAIEALKIAGKIVKRIEPYLKSFD